MKDIHGRTIDRLRVSVTDRCDLRCVYCMPPEGIDLVRHDQVLSYDEIVDVVRFLIERGGLTRVRITGGEPLVRPALPVLVEKLSRLGLEDLALTTNAQLLAPKAKELKEAGLHRVNISLDTLREDRFRTLSRTGRLERTIAGIEAALAAGLRPVKLNTVLMKGFNDDEIVDLARFSMKRGIEHRFLELMEIGEARTSHGWRFLSMNDALERIEREFRLEELPRPPGSAALSFGLSNGDGPAGRVGFIAPVTRPFCDQCRRLRLSATGLLRGCLMNRGGVDLRPILRGGEETEEDREEHLFDALRKTVSMKPWTSDRNTGVGMHLLGG